MSQAKIQLRGHCQLCGREQAVVQGRMSKHGYQVKNGWFQGVCGGHGYAPVEQDRKAADHAIASIRSQCAELDRHAEDLKAGRTKPKKAPVGVWHGAELVDFHQAPAHIQKHAVANAIVQASNRAHQGRRIADMVEAIADQYHGKPLAEVVPPAAPEAIIIGDRRITQRWGAVEAQSIERGMVRYKAPTGYIYKMSTRSWRNLPTA